MEDIYVFGASGFAVEAAQLTLRTGKYRIAGFIDKDEFVTAGQSIIINKALVVPVIPQSVFLTSCNNSGQRISAIIAIANSEIAQNIFDAFKEVCEFPNIIDPSAQLNDIASIGFGNLIFQNVVLSWNVTIGDFNKFLFAAHVGHESTIGNFNELNPKVSISGKCIIGDGNILGVGSMILQGKKIGNKNSIGLGAVLIRNVKSDETWFGNPAKKIIY